MKRTFFLIIIMAEYAFLSAQSTVVFWTNETEYLPIKIYVHGEYQGIITKAYKSAPDCYTLGCVTVGLSGHTATYKATSQDGSNTSGSAVYKDGCNSHKMVLVPSTEHFSNKKTTQTSNGSYSSRPSNDNSSSSNAAAGAGMILISLAVVAGEVILNSDLYVTGILSDRYGGMEFGFRNSWNDHIAFEQSVVWRYALDKSIPYFLTTTHDESFQNKKSNWGCNFRLLYNLFERDDERLINPYIGFGCDYMDLDGFFVSGAAGFTLGNKYIKMDCRYTIGQNFYRRKTPVNQLQIGLIITYQYKRFGFFN